MGLQIEYTKQERPGSLGRSTVFLLKGALTHHPLCGRWYGLRPPCALRGGLRFLRKAPADAFGIDGATGKVTSVPLPVASENLPPAAFRCLRGTRDEGRETEVIKTGNLPFGSKGYQPWHRPFCCCGGSLYELFSDLQRL